MAESWAWKVWSNCLWRMSNTHTKPFLPPVISSCCLGAYCSTVAPFSWQGKAVEVWEGIEKWTTKPLDVEGKPVKRAHWSSSYHGPWYCLVKSEYPKGKHFCGQCKPRIKLDGQQTDVVFNSGGESRCWPVIIGLSCSGNEAGGCNEGKIPAGLGVALPTLSETRE